MPLIASCSSLCLLVLLSKYQMIQALGKSSLLLGWDRPFCCSGYLHPLAARGGMLCPWGAQQTLSLLKDAEVVGQLHAQPCTIPLPPQAGGFPGLAPQQEGLEGKNKLGHVHVNGDEG